MFDKQIQLLQRQKTLDKYNQEKYTITKRAIFAEEKEITRYEYYHAKKSNTKLACKFIIHILEFQQERQLEYNGKIYEIVRTYKLNERYIEITCEESETQP